MLLLVCGRRTRDEGGDRAALKGPAWKPGGRNLRTILVFPTRLQSGCWDRGGGGYGIGQKEVLSGGGRHPSLCKHAKITHKVGTLSSPLTRRTRLHQLAAVSTDQWESTTFHVCLIYGPDWQGNSPLPPKTREQRGHLCSTCLYFLNFNKCV